MSAKKAKTAPAASRTRGGKAAADPAARHYAGGVVDDIMVVGVGGQGVIVAAAIIADAALLHGGLEVKLSETRGMSQRGGSVSSHIRIGATVIAPSISPGEVDYLLAFEAAEGLRLAPSVVPGGVTLVVTFSDRSARVGVTPAPIWGKKLALAACTNALAWRNWASARAMFWFVTSTCSSRAFNWGSL